MVRLAFSEALADAINPPRHLIIALACDEPEVSIPVLANSPALLDGELIHSVQFGTDEQQMAVACRPILSSAICKMLAKESCENACLVLMTNTAARMCPADFYVIAQRFGTSKDIRKCMLARHDIGMKARVLLIEHYAMSLIGSEEVSDEKARIRREKELIEVCDKATITYAAQINDHEIHDVVVALIERKKLTTAFLLRSICMGNLSLFAHALSVLSEQPLARVERVLKDNRDNTFHAIYTKAGLPTSALNVFRQVISSWRNYLTNTEEHETAKLPYLVTREVLANYEGNRDGLVDELLMLLRKICTEAARDNARKAVEQLSLKNQALPALEAPKEEAEEKEEEQISQEDLMIFAVHLADELADMALEDEAILMHAADKLVADNYDPKKVDLDLALPRRHEQYSQAGNAPEIRAA
jgi:uncharacterized protein (DUF2336 family)